MNFILKQSTDSDCFTKALLAINKAYIEAIDEKLQNLMKKLEVNRKQQTDVIIQITPQSSSLIDKRTIKSHAENLSKSNDSELNKLKLNYFLERFVCIILKAVKN